jgi:cold shock CspA family protein
MGRSQETFNKKEVRNKKEKKRKDKEAKRLAKKEIEKKSSLEDMMVYVDYNGNITETPPDPNKRIAVDVESIQISVAKSEATDDEDVVRKGTVTFFNDSKGYGFIKDSVTQESVFVHANNLLEDIKENNIVEYEVEMGQKGPTGVRVKVFREPPPAPKVKEGEEKAKETEASTETSTETSTEESEASAENSDEKSDEKSDEESEEKPEE